jgi:hypothetical protein
MTQRVNYNLVLLIKFCNENHITLLKDYSQQKITKNTIIEGKCLREGCLKTFEKTFSLLINVSNGYCKKCTIDNSKEKIKATCLENMVLNIHYNHKKLEKK